MINKIAPAVERCKRSIYLGFFCCNLDQKAVLRLATAVEKSTCIGSIYCKGNPGNNDSTNEAMKRAIIATKSPIEKWDDADLPEDIKLARREANPLQQTAATMAVPSFSSTHAPTTEEFHLAEREVQSIPPQLASKKEELKFFTEQIAREEAEKKAMGTRVRELHEQVVKVQTQIQELGLKAGASRSARDKAKAQGEELKKQLFRHQAVIKRMQELKDMLAQLNPTPSAATTAPPPPKTHDVANLCAMCSKNAISASFNCGHCFCNVCAGPGFESEKRECPTCRKRIKGGIPSF